MLGVKYFRHAGPNDHVAPYVNGRLRSQGRGLSFWIGPRTTIAIVPASVQSIPFIFVERTNDDQDVSVTGELRLTIDPSKALALHDLSVDPGTGRYRKDGLEKAHDHARALLRPLVRTLVNESSIAQALRGVKANAAMPDYIPAIRNWHIARVNGTQGREAAAQRAAGERSQSGWTHVWAQEFEKLDDLEIDYMVHTYHWAVVDRWFDPESPERIVAPRLRPRRLRDAAERARLARMSHQGAAAATHLPVLARD